MGSNVVSPLGLTPLWVAVAGSSRVALLGGHLVSAQGARNLESSTEKLEYSIYLMKMDNGSKALNADTSEDIKDFILQLKKKNPPEIFLSNG